MNYPQLLSRVIQAKMFRSAGFPRPEPLSLAMSVTSRCMAGCRTCNVKSTEYDELSVPEYEKIFRRLRDKPLWVTVTGGEPFLREDLPDIIHSLYARARPTHITIPTNGWLEDIVPKTVRQIARKAPDTRFIVHVSIDGIGRAHDDLRGLPESFDRAIFTFQRLRNMALPNVIVGIHTVISQFNIDRIAHIQKYIREFNPDAHHFEIAWPRHELNNLDADISPTAEQYATIAEDLESALRGERAVGSAAVMRSLRIEYYRMSAKSYAERKQSIPCFAGTASAHIAADGNVWACCTRGAAMGNLRENDYYFHQIWLSKEADAVRKEIAEGQCWCLLANAAYTSLLCDLGTVRRGFLRAFYRSLLNN